jgi:hypothetical protein
VHDVPVIWFRIVYFCVCLFCFLIPLLLSRPTPLLADTIRMIYQEISDCVSTISIKHCCTLYVTVDKSVRDDHNLMRKSKRRTINKYEIVCDLLMVNSYLSLKEIKNAKRRDMDMNYSNKEI